MAASGQKQPVQSDDLSGSFRPASMITFGSPAAARLSDCGQLLTRTTGFASRPVQPFVMSLSEELDIVNE